MPKIVNVFYKMKKRLKELRVENEVDYELNLIEESIVFKNQPIMAIFNGYDQEKNPLFECPSCHERVYSDWLFCPYCAKKIKYKKGV
jgi:hypothetical protein